MWTVTRQENYISGDYSVEMSKGDFSGVNAGCLEFDYEGEGKTYSSAVKALEVAIAIRDAWSKEKTMREITIFLGMSDPDEKLYSLDDPSLEELRKFVTEQDAKILA